MEQKRIRLTKEEILAKRVYYYAERLESYKAELEGLSSSVKNLARRTFLEGQIRISEKQYEKFSLKLKSLEPSNFPVSRTQ